MISPGSMCQIRQHLHHADEQGFSCPIPKSQPAGAGDAMCLWPCFGDPGEEQDYLSQRPDPSQSATEQKLLALFTLTFSLVLPLFSRSPGDFRGSKDHPASDCRQPSLLAQTMWDSHPHPLTTALHPAPSEIPRASGLTRCSGSRVTSVNEETEPHPCPSPNYRTLKWASSPDIPALFWGSSISAGAGCCPHGSASSSEVGPSTLLHLSSRQSCPKPDPQFLHIYPHSV